jgi:hypothetical protein
MEMLVQSGHAIPAKLAKQKLEFRKEILGGAIEAAQTLLKGKDLRALGISPDAGQEQDTGKQVKGKQGTSTPKVPFAAAANNSRTTCKSALTPMKHTLLNSLQEWPCCFEG